MNDINNDIEIIINKFGNEYIINLLTLIEIFSFKSKLGLYDKYINKDFDKIFKSYNKLINCNNEFTTPEKSSKTDSEVESWNSLILKPAVQESWYTKGKKTTAICISDRNIRSSVKNKRNNKK